MRHSELRDEGRRVGDELQDAAEECSRLADTIEDVDRFPDTDDWLETIDYTAQEVVAQLDTLASRCAEARDRIANLSSERTLRDGTTTPPLAAPSSPSRPLPGEEGGQP